MSVYVMFVLHFEHVRNKVSLSFAGCLRLAFKIKKFLNRVLHGVDDFY